jgi:hypothetical protein
VQRRALTRIPAPAKGDELNGRHGTLSGEVTKQDLCLVADVSFGCGGVAL